MGGTAYAHTAYDQPPASAAPYERVDALPPPHYKQRQSGGGLRRRILFRPWRSNGTSMANTKSAKKATRKIAHRTEVNKARRSRMRSSLRTVEDAISSGNKAAAQAALVAAQPALMRAARNGIIHKNAASRKVSRLTHRIAKLG
jgi:small subunit ribosomal protein S20